VVYLLQPVWLVGREKARQHHDGLFCYSELVLARTNYL
jgi:hypothetical protein